MSVRVEHAKRVLVTIGLMCVLWGPGVAQALDLQQWSNGSWLVATRVAQAKELATNVHTGKSLAEVDTKSPMNTLTQREGASAYVPLSFYATATAGKAKYFVGLAGDESHTYDSTAASWAPPAMKKAALQPISNNSGSMTGSIYLSGMQGDWMQERIVF